MANQPMQQPPPSAAQPDTDAGSGVAAGERKTYEALLAGLLDFVWGQGQADIQRQIQGATKDTLATIIGHIVFALVQQGADQAEKAGKHLSMDMLLGVATEMIESLEKMAGAMNIQFDPKAVGLQALVQALNDYAESLPPGSQAQQDAKAALKEFGQQNIDTAASTVQQIGAAHGAAPFTDADAGTDPNEAQPGEEQQEPRQGLMGAAS